MPRRNSQNNAENSTPSRRVSARIAAIQTASPATKTPAKASPRKRKSDTIKVTMDDNESQQSRVKSEGNSDELNGIESISNKDQSVSDIQEAPLKKSKVVESISSAPESDNEPVEVPVERNSLEHVEEKLDSITSEFEIIEKDAVPSADSVEVAEAISVQGEDGNLLVGFLQVHKDELPTASSLQVKEVSVSEPEQQIINPISAEQTITETSEERDVDTHVPTTVNGDETVPPTHQTEDVDISVPVDASTVKMATVDSPMQPAPASGDVAMDSIATEPIPQ